MKWFKFYGQDYVSDPKMLSLNASERSCWITLLAYSSVNDNGMITFLDEQKLMIQAGIDPNTDEWKNTMGILNKLEKLGMIQNDNGMITISNWSKRQETNLSSYERVKRYREKKQKDNKVKRNDNAMITLDKNRIDKNRIDNIYIYGEFKNVKLTKEEFQKLVDKLGESNTNVLIEELSSYMASRGKRYSSHYATIQTWARMKIQKHKEKLQPKQRYIA